MGPSEGVPIPDPTVLTTEQLLRETAAISSLFDSKLRGMQSIFEERFNSVATQFDLVERQRVEQKKDTSDAVAAALAAAKEAVKEQTTASGLSITKSETLTAEQMKQLDAKFTVSLAGQVTSFNDLKDRVVVIESSKRGGNETSANFRSTATVAIAFVSMLLIGLGIAFASYAANHP